MGVFDRVRAALGATGQATEVSAEPRLDTEARRAQLGELEQALRALARDMAGREELMVNPGWRGRVDDLRFAADEAAQLSRSEFDRAALDDLAAQVRPLYGPGPVPAEYAPHRAAHDRVLAAVAAIREPLDSEEGQR